MKTIDKIILILILLVALLLRLYHLTAPLADLHSWRQADTAAVSRNFARSGIDLMHPTYDDLSSLQTGVENPKGVRYVEFPLYNAITAISYHIAPTLPVEVHGRLVSIIFSMCIIAVLYYLSLKETSRAAAIVASLIYAVMPAFVFFSRVVLPETMAVSCAFISLFFLHRSFDKSHTRYSLIMFFISALFYSVGILVKPTAIFYGIALAFVFIREMRLHVLTNWRPYVYAIISIVPFILWRLFIRQYPEGIPPSDWLIGYVNTAQGLQKIFLRPAFFRWIFVERIGISILGIYTTGLMITGIIGSTKKYLIFSIFLSAMVYLMVFEGGNVQHEYYQTIALPALAIICGSGAGILWELAKKGILNMYLIIPTFVVFFALSFFVSYYKVKDYYYVPQDLPPIAYLIQKFTKPDDKIVTDRLGDTTLLYLADRKGAPAIYKEIDELKKLGYSYLVTANKDIVETMRSQKKDILVESNQFAIIRL